MSVIYRTKVVAVGVALSSLMLFSGCSSNGPSATAIPTPPASTQPSVAIGVTSLADYTGPTVTASGPLLVGATKGLIEGFPKTIGGFPFFIPPEISYGSGSVTVGFRYPNAKYPYAIELTFDTAQFAYASFQLALRAMPDGQRVTLGDGAIVSSQSKVYWAAMQYRNVFVDIPVPDYFGTDPGPIPTNDELIAILKDVYAGLSKGQ